MGKPFKSGLRYENMEMSNTLQDTDLFSAVSLGALNNGRRQRQKKHFFLTGTARDKITG